MKKTILIADDDKDNRLVASLMLKIAGYDVVEAEDAVEAIRAAKAAPKPDLVLLDMSLPGLSGWEAAGRLKAISGAPMPVVAFTAHALKGDEDRALAAGCDGYLTKPCSKAQLIDTVRRHLGGS